MSLSTSEQLQVLADLNKISYSPPVSGSLSNRRQFRKYAFQPLNYSEGQIAQLQINSGSDYISGPTSYIVATVTFLGTGNLQWNENTGSTGSAFNIFSEYQHSHRSGDLIDRTDRVNVLISALASYISNEYKSKTASALFEYGSVATHGTTTSNTYVYPLFLLSGLFAQKALIPAQLMAGSRMKIQLERGSTALIGAGASYSVENMNLVLDSVDLYDSAKKMLLEQSANVRTSGLQYSYHSWFHLSKQESTGQLNFDINYSAAKTITLLVKVRETAKIALNTANSMDCEGYIYSKWRMRIGALTMPEFEVETAEEAYHIANLSMNNPQDDDLLDVCYGKSAVNLSEFKGAAGIVAQSLEKNPIVGLSGEVTNNSRQLNFSATLNDEKGRTFDAYLKHLRVVNVMMDNIVVNR